MSSRNPLYPNTERLQQGPNRKESIEDTVTNKVADIAGRIKDQAGAAADKVSDGFDKGRKAAAGTLHQAASTLREKADGLPGGQTTAGIAERLADTVESTSTYLREHDMEDMKADVERLVRRNPTQSLIAACVVGFLIGRAFRR